MSTFNLSTMENIIFNGVDLDKVIYNGTVVWEKVIGQLGYLIPYMTGYNTPDNYGIVYASSEYNNANWRAWQPFSANAGSKGWLSGSSSTEHKYIQFCFVKPVYIEEISYRITSDAADGKNYYATTADFILYDQDDNILKTITISIPGTKASQQEEMELTNINTHSVKTIRLDYGTGKRTRNGSSSTTAYYCELAHLDCYGYYEDNKKSDEYPVDNYTALIPTLTSNTSNGTASSFSQYSTTNAAWKAFDGNSTTTHYATANGSSNWSSQYLQYVWSGTKVVDIDLIKLNLFSNDTNHRHYFAATMYIDFYDVSGNLITTLNWDNIPTEYYHYSVFYRLDSTIKNVHKIKLRWSTRLADGSSSTTAWYADVSCLQVYSQTD